MYKATQTDIGSQFVRIPAEVSEGFTELEEFLCALPLEDNNAVFNLCCRLCSAYERKAFLVVCNTGHIW